MGGDGLLVLSPNAEGKASPLSLYRADPEAMQRLGEPLPSTVTNSTTPALAGGLLVVRAHDRLRCYDLRADADR